MNYSAILLIIPLVYHSWHEFIIAFFLDVTGEHF